MPLLTSPLVTPLTEDWRETLDTVARGRGWPSSRDPERLAVNVASLSAAYNTKGASASLHSRDALSARLGFSFARDVPKSAGAIRELVATGALAMPSDRALRILDLGAGLGASSWGVTRALEALARFKGGRIEATCVDDDAEALSLAVAIGRVRSGHPAPIELALEPLHVSALQGLSRVRGPFDLVLLGQVLSEVGADSDAERLERHVSLVRSSLDSLAPDGSVVIVEPALRERTRHLHAVRDALLARHEGVTVFAPCVHEAPCPALAEEGQWCHEDLDVDLPAWLVPVARAAGLRWQGLTFSYLVLRKDGRSLRSFATTHVPPAALVRVVSGAIVTKGKREAFVCGEVQRDGVQVIARVRAMRVDREASASNVAWTELARGGLLACSPPLDADKPRFRQGSGVMDATPAPGRAAAV
jgi:SAM-dependent methyltransferase